MGHSYRKYCQQLLHILLVIAVHEKSNMIHPLTEIDQIQGGNMCMWNNIPASS